MAQVLVLSEAEVTALLDLEQLLAALADALVSHSAGRASVPPRVAASATDGILGAMLTVYKSTGHAVEDAAAADLVYRRAVEAGAGTSVPI